MSFLQRQAQAQVRGEENKEWYYNFHYNLHNTFRGDSTRSTKFPTSKGTRADGPKICFDRATQWEKIADWMVDVGTQT